MTTAKSIGISLKDPKKANTDNDDFFLGSEERSLKIAWKKEWEPVRSVLALFTCVSAPLLTLS